MEGGSSGGWVWPEETRPLALKEWNVTVEALVDGWTTLLLRKGGIREPHFVPRCGGGCARGPVSIPLPLSVCPHLGRRPTRQDSTVGAASSEQACPPHHCRAKSFLLFPTSFHTDASVLQADAAGRYQDLLSWELGSEVPFTVLAEVTGLWTTMDPEGILDATSSFHIWGPKFVETRLKWRKTQPVTVMELRAYRLREPMVLPRREEYAGCFRQAGLLGTSAAQRSSGRRAHTALPAAGWSPCRRG